MKKCMWRNVVAASVAAAVALTAGAATTTALAYGFTTQQTQSFRYAADTAVVGKNLLLNSGLAHVSVSMSPDAEVHVRADGLYRGDAPTVDISEDGSDIAVECPIGNSGSCDVYLELEIPTSLTLDISGAAADIVLSNVDAQTTVATSAGSVTARGSAGTLDVTTGSGDVEIADAATSEIHVTTTSGLVTLDSLVAPDAVRVQNTLGDSMIDLPAAESYDVDAVSGTGDVEIDVVDDPNSTRSVSVSSEEGQISVRRR